MKIFNVEDGKKVVFVQLDDISMLLYDNSIRIPNSVLERFFKKDFIVTDENKSKFYLFKNPDEIDFFENIDWIIDFKEFYKMRSEELLSNIDEVKNELLSLSSYNSKFNNFEKVTGIKLPERLLILKHKKEDIERILNFKKGYTDIPLPLVPDCEGFIVQQPNCPYIARQGLNPFQMLVYRVDNIYMFLKDDDLPNTLIGGGEEHLVDSNLSNNEFFNYFDRESTFTIDRRLFIVTYKIRVPEKEREKSELEKYFILGADSQDTGKKLTLIAKIKDKFKKLF